MIRTLLPSCLSCVRLICLVLFCSGCYTANAQSNAPNWTSPPPGAFTQTVTITAAVVFEGDFSENTDDEVGVFVDGDLRAAGTVLDATSSDLGGPANILFSITVPGGGMPGDPQEILEFRVYHAATDMIYISSVTVPFVGNQVLGAPTDPFEIPIGTPPDEPITLREVGEQLTLVDVPFQDIDLDTLLVSIDNDPVLFSIEPIDPGVMWTLNGSVLETSPETGFIGVASVRVIATEQSPGTHADTIIIDYRVLPEMEAPGWTGLEPQNAGANDTFPDVNLDSLVVFPPGDCFTLDYSPVFNRNLPDTSVSWSAIVPTEFLSTMTYTVRVVFTPNFEFDHPDDRLAAFIDGELRGLAEPEPANGQRLFFLTVGNNSGNPDTITIRFFSGDLRQVFDFPLSPVFISQAQVGTPDDPEELDLSPFLLTIDDDGVLMTEIRDTSLPALQAYSFIVADCTFPEVLNAEMVVPSCYNPGAPVEPVVQLVAGPVNVCEVKSLDLESLVMNINTEDGYIYSWSGDGDGQFLDQLGQETNLYPQAVAYVPGPLDIKREELTLRLDVAGGPNGACPSPPQGVPVRVLRVGSGDFFWSGE